MNPTAYRDLQLLTDIASNQAVTQRGLAQKYGFALGLTNFLLRRLVNKGYVKIVNLKRNRLHYLLTPKGLAEKARLTYHYLEYSLALFRHTRTLMTKTLSQMERPGRQRVVIYGTGELAEIAFLAMQERGLHIAAVLEEPGNGKTTFMSQPVRRLAALPELEFDWIVIATFKQTRAVAQQLRQLGVLTTKIIILADQSLPKLSDVVTAPMLEHPELVGG